MQSQNISGQKDEIALLIESYTIMAENVRHEWSFIVDIILQTNNQMVSYTVFQIMSVKSNSRQLLTQTTLQ